MNKPTNQDNLGILHNITRNFFLENQNMFPQQLEHLKISFEDCYPTPTHNKNLVIWVSKLLNNIITQ